ncbi:MAG TPA: hypothetical protein DCG28_01725 [Lachnospiraceae bacterium]|nr:hypothetical protein [Lachnospiraceae bacterium]
MKTVNKNKILKAVDGYDKRIEKIREQLENLESKKNTVMLESMTDKLKEAELSLDDFFRIIEKEIKEKNKPEAPIKQGDFKMGDFNK